jgi:hypothetical protein
MRKWGSCRRPKQTRRRCPNPWRRSVYYRHSNFAKSILLLFTVWATFSAAREFSASGQGLPPGGCWHHSRCTSDSCRLAALPIGLSRAISGNSRWNDGSKLRFGVVTLRDTHGIQDTIGRDRFSRMMNTLPVTPPGTACFARMSSVASPKTARNASVSTALDATQFARTPNGASSNAR